MTKERQAEEQDRRQATRSGGTTNGTCSTTEEWVFYETPTNRNLAPRMLTTPEDKTNRAIT